MKMKICIITSVRNCLTETKAYLDSLRQHAPSNLDQVIMIDDGSEQRNPRVFTFAAIFI